MRQYPVRTGPLMPDTGDFSPEQADGSSAGMPRPTNRQMPRPFAETQSIIPFSIEMVVGNQPSRNRMRLGPRIPLPLSQTTHVQNAFAIDMVAGNKPAQRRSGFRAHRFQQPFMNNDFVASVNRKKFLPILFCGQ